MCEKLLGASACAKELHTVHFWVEPKISLMGGYFSVKCITFRRKKTLEKLTLPRTITFCVRKL